MAIGKNYVLTKNHFKKHWERRVRVHLDQAGKKASRRQTRALKIAAASPNPVDLLRPVVRCPTLKYNRKVRAGRGFTAAELAAVGLHAKAARVQGIAVDLRRSNRSVETFEANVARLTAYKKAFVVIKGKSDATTPVPVAAAFPIEQPAPESKPRAVVVPDQTAYRTLRLARSERKYKGIREKRAAEKAAAAAEKKK